MSLRAQIFWTNMAWIAVAMSMVVMAYLKTGSLHSFWFLGVYFLGHSYEKTVGK